MKFAAGTDSNWFYPGKTRGQTSVSRFPTLHNWIARTLNRAWAAVGSSGVTSNYLVKLEVAGRKSGRMISLPVVMAVVDGCRYLVSMLRDEANWVQNIRAAGGRAVLHSGGREKGCVQTEYRRNSLNRPRPTTCSYTCSPGPAGCAGFEKLDVVTPSQQI